MIETHAGCDSVRRETVTRGGGGVVKERVKVRHLLWNNGGAPGL